MAMERGTFIFRQIVSGLLDFVFGIQLELINNIYYSYLKASELFCNTFTIMKIRDLKIILLYFLSTYKRNIQMEDWTITH